MGKQIKSLEKDIETFPPPQNEKDKFVEKMTISFTTVNASCLVILGVVTVHTVIIIVFLYMKTKKNNASLNTLRMSFMNGKKKKLYD